MNITDIIQGALASKTTRFAFELLPPLKGEGTGSVFSAIDPLMEFNPAYINVTFHRETLTWTCDTPDGDSGTLRLILDGADSRFATE